MVCPGCDTLACLRMQQVWPIEVRMWYNSVPQCGKCLDGIAQSEAAVYLGLNAASPSVLPALCMLDLAAACSSAGIDLEIVTICP